MILKAKLKKEKLYLKSGNYIVAVISVFSAQLRL